MNTQKNQLVKPNACVIHAHGAPDMANTIFHSECIAIGLFSCATCNLFLHSRAIESVRLFYEYSLSYSVLSVLAGNASHFMTYEIFHLYNSWYLLHGLLVSGVLFLLLLSAFW